MSKTYSARGCGWLRLRAESFSKRRSAVFWKCSSRKVPDQMQISKEQGRSFALSTTGEVYELCGGRKFYFVDVAPLSFSFEILHLAVVTPIGCA